MSMMDGHNSNEENKDNMNKETAAVEVDNAVANFDKNALSPAEHPLQNKWVLWYDKSQNNSSDAWGQNITAVYTFATVEDFWRLYNNIIPASKLPVNCTYNLFKEGIRPEWEDPRNTNGGRWVYNVPKNKKSKIDDWWLNTVLGLIGETMNDDGDICGAVVSLRKSADRIAVWTATSSDQSLMLKIGQQLRRNADLPGSIDIQFSVHGEKKGRRSAAQLTA